MVCGRSGTIARVRCIVRVVPPRHGSCSAVHPVQFNSSASTYCIVLGTRKAANCAIHCSSGFCREPHESRPCEVSEVRPRVRESRPTTTTTTSGLLSYGGVEPSIEAEQVWRSAAVVIGVGPGRMVVSLPEASRPAAVDDVTSSGTVRVSGIFLSF